MKLKTIGAVCLAVTMLMTGVTGCSKTFSSSSASSTQIADQTKISVVCTIFPQYDFVRQIAGNDVNLTMLLPPGAESHSFEPTPQDIKEINNCNLFVYVGGDSDSWIDSILSSLDNSKIKTLRMMDSVKLVQEELVDGMQPEKEDSSTSNSADADTSPEMDEHVWTSPANSMLIVQDLCNTLCQIDPNHAADYKTNTKNYLERLNNLDSEFRDVVNHAKRKEIIVGDRFPFRYFCEEYGLNYYAAFPGCSTDTEASASTVAFLINKVKADQIPVVFHIELSNEQMCNSICDATGAKSELLNAVHNVSADDFAKGVTYIDLMEHNVDVLKEALN
jgi:zinc transport system substrate-binding protein